MGGREVSSTQDEIVEADEEGMVGQQCARSLDP